MSVEALSDGAKTLAPFAGVSETLLIPVWARAMETGHRDGLISDAYAVRIMQEVPYDYARYADNGWRTQIGIAVRTRVLDRVVGRFLTDFPDGIIVNMGCGLDARSFRMDNGCAEWIELDFPEVIQVRRLFFAEDARHYFIAGSALDMEWLDVIPKNRAILFLAEGLLMYLQPESVRVLVCSLAERFPGAEFVFESIGKALVGNTALHDTVSKCGNAPFLWGIDSGFELVNWSSSIQFLEDYHYFSCPLRRWRWAALVSWVPAVRRMTRMYRYRFVAEHESSLGRTR
ncbi:class I SAM-dependent methyltransferase [Pseudodesulfovibrio piezophilus]|uniref:Uncharacterized protein n=1 Tax=Pseudodesulfovibrio piezophilus (strain DSM 21447 / JCM 15486 / C1TLV30) TaxID=1322246 RepID=M1WVH9_PSEP2|nr:class I SAM-dependent methyltransferase [Pseudodesulfovibrio piezophilus]CCH48468.1 conserved protein of unknown function [Pseudodesulfovibrio piezophilus C1TLV30]